MLKIPQVIYWKKKVSTNKLQSRLICASIAAKILKICSSSRSSPLKGLFETKRSIAKNNNSTHDALRTMSNHHSLLYFAFKLYQEETSSYKPSTSWGILPTHFLLFIKSCKQSKRLLLNRGEVLVQLVSELKNTKDDNAIVIQEKSKMFGIQWVIFLETS